VPTTSSAKPSDMTSGDRIGGCVGPCPRTLPLVRREGDGDDGGAGMSCTYPIDLKPRMLPNVGQYKTQLGRDEREAY
jgi:hypothetical protein